LLINSVLKNKEKNKIKEEIVNKIKIRFQIIQDLPTKELRSVIDQGKKALKEGIVIAYAIHSSKLGLAIGVTEKLTEKYSAVDLIKVGSSVLGGKGGGGRKDFRSGRRLKNRRKIDESYKEILKKIN
jgi:alanyl-tRNA synthetase